jgi:hypothetical protein
VNSVLQPQAVAAQKTNKAADKAAACGTAKQIDDLLATTLMAMPMGSQMSAEAKSSAGTIMGGANQISEFTGSIKKTFSCK